MASRTINLKELLRIISSLLNNAGRVAVGLERSYRWTKRLEWTRDGSRRIKSSSESRRFSRRFEEELARYEACSSESGPTPRLSWKRGI
jgi:hypothetical protein